MAKKDEFKVGQRVYFPVRHGIGSFGFVVGSHPEDSTVSIRDDNGTTYERLMSVVTIVKDA